MVGPKTLGAFEIEARLGAGAMGTVYRAFQPNLKREVVVKTLHTHLAQDPDLVARFEREARHAADLQHPNTVQVYDFGVEDGTYYIAMELVRGLDLKQLLGSRGIPPTPLALLILRDVCRGLEAAHDKDVIHRDIKPANLMVTDRGIVKVMDFGLARQAAESSTITVQGSVMGSAAYMSPEQAQGQKVDHRSDIFSTGLVAYEILSGKRTFPGESYALVLHDVIFNDPKPLSEQNPDLDPAVVELVHHMIAKDVDQRCPSMSEAHDRLEEITRQLDLRRGDSLLAEYVREGLETLSDRAEPAPIVIGRQDVASEIADTELAIRPPEELAPEDLKPEDKTRVLETPTDKTLANEVPVQSVRPPTPEPERTERRSPLSKGLRVAAAVVVLVLLGWMVSLILPGGDVPTERSGEPKVDSASVAVLDTEPVADASSSILGSPVTAIDTVPSGAPDSTGQIASEPVTDSETNTSATSQTEAPEPPRPIFEKRYYVGTIPWAYVFVDDDPTRRNDPQGFQITLKEGRRRFVCKNKAGDVVGRLSYTVSRGDPNNVLILNIETGGVEARP